MPELHVVALGPAAALAVCGALYAWAVTRAARPHGMVLPLHTSSAFLIGLMLVAVALTGPVDARAHELFAWHMVQHLLLVSAAAPLLAIGRPIEVMNAALDRGSSPSLTPLGLATSSVVQVSVLMLWHVPWLYERALTNQPLHALEHVTLLGSAFVLWHHLLRSAGAWRGAGLLVLFFGTFPPMAYGLGMTLASTSWYAPYTLQDQQLAGVLMWAYGGAAVVVGGVGLFADWLSTAEVDP
jgi:cytochrome c oxidase assembly factor CtaG